MYMKFLEYGDPNKKCIILIHGFQSPYQIYEDYISHYSRDFHIIVPILTGHDPEIQEDFQSFEQCAKELETFYMERYGTKVYAVYGMSMGGVLACQLWERRQLQIHRLILDSSPLLSYNRLICNVLTKQYLKMTHKAQNRDEKTLQRAVRSIIRKEQLDYFLTLLDHMSDTTIINCIEAVSRYSLSKDINTPNTYIYYFYGDKVNELLCRKVAKFLKKHYAHSTTICLSNKGHCEDALLYPDVHIKRLDHILYEDKEYFID